MTNIAIEHGPVEIVSFRINNGDFPVRYVCLPEGTSSILRFSHGFPMKNGGFSNDPAIPCPSYGSSVLHRRDPPGPGPVARLLDLGAVHPLGLRRRFHLRAEATWSTPAVDNVYAYIYIYIIVCVKLYACMLFCI